MKKITVSNRTELMEALETASRHEVTIISLENTTFRIRLDPIQALANQLQDLRNQFGFQWRDALLKKSRKFSKLAARTFKTNPN